MRRGDPWIVIWLLTKTKSFKTFYEYRKSLSILDVWFTLIRFHSYTVAISTYMMPALTPTRKRLSLCEKQKIIEESKAAGFDLNKTAEAFVFISWGYFLFAFNRVFLWVILQSLTKLDFKNNLSLRTKIAVIKKVFKVNFDCTFRYVPR